MNSKTEIKNKIKKFLKPIRRLRYFGLGVLLNFVIIIAGYFLAPETAKSGGFFSEHIAILVTAPWLMFLLLLIQSIFVFKRSADFTNWKIALILCFVYFSLYIFTLFVLLYTSVYANSLFPFEVIMLSMFCLLVIEATMVFKPGKSKT